MPKVIEKAVKLTELKSDLANLMRQAAAVTGAIQYINSKIAELEKLEPVAEEVKT